MDENDLEIRKILANNLRYLRLQKKLSQEELASICKLHRTYVGSVERMERNITLSTLVKFANALNVTVVELLSRKDGGK